MVNGLLVVITTLHPCHPGPLHFPDRPYRPWQHETVQGSRRHPTRANGPGCDLSPLRFIGVATVYARLHHPSPALPALRAGCCSRPTGPWVLRLRLHAEPGVRITAAAGLLMEPDCVHPSVRLAAGDQQPKTIRWTNFGDRITRWDSLT